MDAVTLLISNTPQTDFAQRLQGAAVGLARIKWVPPKKKISDGWLKKLNPALIVIDVTGMADLTALISIAHFEIPQARIVIASALPNWQQARDAYQSGAVDCLLKSVSEEELRAYLTNLFAQIQSA